MAPAAIATISLSDSATWPLRMTVAEVAYVMRWSKRSLYDRIKQGRFPKSDDGRSWDRDVVERYAKGGIKAFERDAEKRARRESMRMVGGAR